jgi:hypothetical protein
MDFENMQFIHGQRTIVSIYPEKLVRTLDIGPTMQAGKTEYKIDGAPKGEHRSLVIYDGFSSVIDYQNCQFVGKTPMTAVPEPAERIARELVREWTTGAGSGPGQQPGIMMIAGKEPTKNELAYLTNTQNACFEWLVLTARAFWDNHQYRNINEKHRIAGKWLGLKEKWIAEVGTEMDKGTCAFCYSPMLDPRATICAVCHKEQPAKEAGAPARTLKAQPVEGEPFKTTAVPIIPPVAHPQQPAR